MRVFSRRAFHQDPSESDGHDVTHPRHNEIVKLK